MTTHDRMFAAVPAGRLTAVTGRIARAFATRRAGVPLVAFAIALTPVSSTPVALTSLAFVPLVAFFSGSVDAADGTDSGGRCRHLRTARRGRSRTAAGGIDPDESSLAGERTRFVAARDALAAGDLDRFVELETSLVD